MSREAEPISSQGGGSVPPGSPAEFARALAIAVALAVSLAIPLVWPQRAHGGALEDARAVPQDEPNGQPPAP